MVLEEKLFNYFSTESINFSVEILTNSESWNSMKFSFYCLFDMDNICLKSFWRLVKWSYDVWCYSKVIRTTTLRSVKYWQWNNTKSILIITKYPTKLYAWPKSCQPNDQNFLRMSLSVIKKVTKEMWLGTTNKLLVI